MKQQRALHVCCVSPFYKPAYVYGGPTRSIPSLCEGLARIGCEVTVYTTNANGRTDLEIRPGVPHNVNGATVYYFQRDWGGNYFYSSALAEACYSNFHKFDLVYISSNWGYPFIPACRSARKASVPYIVAPRTSFMRKTWRSGWFKKLVYHYLVERQLINEASTLHYTTELERRESNWLRLRPASFVVPNPVDMTEFERLPARGSFRREHSIPDDTDLVLYLGRLEPRKGLDLTLASFARVASVNSKACLVLAGPEEDDYVQVLMNMAVKSGIADRILFTGYLDARSGLTALVDADVFILTSYSENFGMAVVEAMAIGLPVIISDQVGIAEDLSLEQAALVVSLDIEEIARGLIKLLASTEVRETLGHRAMKVARERFSPKRVAEAMLKEFKEVIDATPPGIERIAIEETAKHT